jgi:hypothetical protein
MTTFLDEASITKAAENATFFSVLQALKKNLREVWGCFFKK